MVSAMALQSRAYRQSRQRELECRRRGVESLPSSCVLNEVRVVTTSFCTSVSSLPLSDVETPPVYDQVFSSVPRRVCRMVQSCVLLWQGHMAVFSGETAAAAAMPFRYHIECTCGGSLNEWAPCEYCTSELDRRLSLI